MGVGFEPKARIPKPGSASNCASGALGFCYLHLGTTIRIHSSAICAAPPAPNPKP